MGISKLHTDADLSAVVQKINEIVNELDELKEKVKKLERFKKYGY